MKATLHIPMTLHDVARAVGHTPPAVSRPIDAVVTDSREADTTSLFFALRGERLDGNDYIEEALRRGAAVICTRLHDGAMTVHDTRAALLALARAYRERLPSLQKTVAVSGSVGKTTVKELLASLLSADFDVHATAGNYNNEIGLSMSFVRSELCPFYVAKGMPIHMYCADNEADVRLCIERGADLITANDPIALMTVLGK